MVSKKHFLCGLALAALLPVLVAILILQPNAATTAILLITALFSIAGALIILSGSSASQPSPPVPAPPDTDRKHTREEPDFFLNRIIPAIDEVLAEHDGKRPMAADPAFRQRLSDKIVPLLTENSHPAAIVEEKEVTVILADLRGFTSIAENYSPLDVADMLNRYFSIMSKIIYHHGGIVDKFIGDSIMALFGVPVSSEDNIEQALCCAVEMQIAMNKFNAENKKRSIPNQFMGIGINTGRVLAGRIGSELHSEYTVIGDEINITSRIEAYTLRGQILISSNTYSKAQNLITTKDPMHISVKGKRDPLIIYEMLAIGPPHNLNVPEREVRKGLRAEVDLPFKFQFCIGKIVSTDLHEGRILDISTGGMLIRTFTEVQPHVNIKFRLAPDIIGIEGDDIYGKIIHVKKKPELYESNIEFTAISSKDSMAIKELVHKIVGNTLLFKT
jgi:adenylate cyclase